MAIGNARRLTPHSTLPEGVPPTTGRELFGGSFPRKRALGTRQPVATTVKARRLGCFPRQTLGEPQRPSGSPVASVGRPSCSAGLTRSLCRETLIKDWLPPGTPVAYGGKPSPFA
ncbi:MAG: hypothetical protein KME49_17875 [Brasilonema octagenarum HA4186-MV1]|nr:hypothetical protein [Brasilonema octagenarum HA4186-MV1]